MKNLVILENGKKVQIVFNPDDEIVENIKKGLNKNQTIDFCDDDELEIEISSEQEKQNQIAELKIKLQKFKEDVEQVVLFGIEREDLQEKKKLCADLVFTLRELEKAEK